MATEEKKTALVTIPFRLAFPQVFEAKAGVPGAKEKFSVTMLFPKDGVPLIPNLPGVDVMGLRRMMAAAIKAEWGEDKAKWPANLRTIDMKTYVSITGKDGWPLRDGDEVPWDGFEGNVFIRAASGFRPGCVDAKVQPVLDKSDVFGGLICRAEVNAYAYKTSGNFGVTFGLNNLQILKDDGARFGGKQRPEDVFDAITSGDSVIDDDVPF